jgi:hypothetical protein
MLSAKGANSDVGGVRAAPNVGARPKLLTTKQAKPLAELIVDGLLTVTPELAQRIIATGRFDRQRPLRAKHILALAEQMRRHEWTEGTQIHFGRTPDGELHLVNGQHRMHAVVKADAAIRFQVLVTNVPTEKELIRLYRRHDRLIAARTVTDTLMAEGVMEVHGLRNEIAGGVYKAVLVLNSRFRRVAIHADPYLARSDEDRLRSAEQWWPIAASFQEMIDKAPANPVKRHLKSGGAMAVALLTVKYQPDIADIFWRGLAEDDGLQMGDPRKAYLRHIYTKKSNSETDAAKAAAAAWNAAYKGAKLEKIVITDGPVVVFGTPFEKAPKKTGEK